MVWIKLHTQLLSNSSKLCYDFQMTERIKEFEKIRRSIFEIEIVNHDSKTSLSLSTYQKHNMIVGVHNKTLCPSHSNHLKNFQELVFHNLISRWGSCENSDQMAWKESYKFLSFIGSFHFSIGQNSSIRTICLFLWLKQTTFIILKR